MMWASACVLMTMAGVLAGCDGSGPSAGGDHDADHAAADPVTVTLAPVRQAALPVYIQASGTLLADETVTLSAKVAGRVQAVGVDLGDQVTQGQRLAELDPTDYQLAIREKALAMNQSLAQLGLREIPEGQVDTRSLPTVRRAASQRRNAQARLERLATLHEQKLVSDQDFNDAQTAAQVATSEYDVAVLNAQAVLAQAMTRQAELATARQHLADTRIVAPGGSDEPSNGGDAFFIGQRMIAQGEYVSQGTPLFILVDDNPIRLRMAVPERYTAKVTQGQPVSVQVQAFEKPFQGQVTRISPQINPANRTFLVEVSVVNDDHLLKPGGFAMGSIQIESQGLSTLVPAAAVTTFAGVSKVFDVHEGKTRQHIVTLGETKDDEVVITSGLEGVEQVISPLPNRTTSGQPVRLAQSQQASSQDDLAAAASLQTPSTNGSE